jgi:hypothetical protein
MIPMLADEALCASVPIRVRHFITNVFFGHLAPGTLPAHIVEKFRNL